MAKLTDDARWLGFTGQEVLFRVDFVRDSQGGYAEPRIEFLIYHCDRYEHVLQTYGVHLSHAEAVDLIAMIDKACHDLDVYQANLGGS